MGKLLVLQLQVLVLGRVLTLIPALLRHLGTSMGIKEEEWTIRRDGYKKHRGGIADWQGDL